jgi:hypothetical protein
LKTLDEHIQHGENFKTYRSHKAQYDRLNAEYETLKKSSGFGAARKAEKALAAARGYYEAHRREITLFGAAEKYLKGVLQSHYDPKKLPPLTKWKEERAAKVAESRKLQQDYTALKNEIREVEIIRKAAENIARQIEPQQKKRAREMEICARETTLIGFRLICPRFRFWRCLNGLQNGYSMELNFLARHAKTYLRCQADYAENAVQRQNFLGVHSEMKIHTVLIQQIPHRR